MYQTFWCPVNIFLCASDLGHHSTLVPRHLYNLVIAGKFIRVLCPISNERRL